MYTNGWNKIINYFQSHYNIPILFSTDNFGRLNCQRFCSMYEKLKRLEDSWVIVDKEYRSLYHKIIILYTRYKSFSGILLTPRFVLHIIRLHGNRVIIIIIIISTRTLYEIYYYIYNHDCKIYHITVITASRTDLTNHIFYRSLSIFLYV